MVIKPQARLALIASVAVTYALPAIAQSASESSHSTESAQNVDEIIVTARRKEELLQDVPASITVFSQEQLRSQNIIKAEDLARYTPSLSVNNNFGSDNSTFAIRGFVQDIGTAPSVGVYFADVVAPRGGTGNVVSGDGAGPGAFFDLQNVQVIKGPQGTLFGRNTTGGAVLLVPQKPTSRFEGYLEGSTGNRDMFRVQGVVNIPIAEAVRLRIGLDTTSRDGWLRNRSGIGPRDFNDIDYTSARASLVVDLAPSVENYTIGTYTISNNNGPLQKLVAANAAFPLLGGLAAQQLATTRAAGDGFYDIRNDVTNPSSRTKTWQVINTTTWGVTDTLTIKNVASYGELRQSLTSALFGTQFRSPAVPALGLPALPVSFAVISPIPGGNGISSQSTFTEELQLQGSPSSTLTWQAGGYFERTKPLGASGTISGPLVSCNSLAALQCADIFGFLASIQDPRVRLGLIPPYSIGSVTTNRSEYSTRDVGIYGQGSWEFAPRFKLTAGLRYTWDRQDSKFAIVQYRYRTFPTFIGSPTPNCIRPGDTLPLCDRQQTATSSAPTWLLGLDYKPSEDVLVYGKYTRGYRTGGVTPGIASAISIFRPERVDTYEAGFKSTFGGPLRAVFNASAFYNDFSNQQLKVGFGDNPAIPGSVSATVAPVNVGKSRIYGVEVDAGVRPFRGLSLNASYSYLNTRIKSVTAVVLPATDPYIVSDLPLAGDRLTLSPKHKIVLSGSYTLPIEQSVGSVSVGGTYTYTSRQVSTLR